MPRTNLRLPPTATPPPLDRARSGLPSAPAELERASDAKQELLHHRDRAAATPQPARAVEPGVWTPPEPYPNLPPPGSDEVPLDAPGVPTDDEPDAPPARDDEEDEPTPDDDDRAPDAAARLERRHYPPCTEAG